QSLNSSPYPPSPSPTEGRGGAGVLAPPSPLVGEGGWGGEGATRSYCSARRVTTSSGSRLKIVLPVVCQAPRCQKKTAEPCRRLLTAGNPSMSLPGIASKAIVTPTSAASCLLCLSRTSSASGCQVIVVQRRPRGLPLVEAAPKKACCNCSRRAA